MMMMRLLLAIVGAVALAGCSAVYSVDPVGEEPYVAEAGEWEGTWIHKEGTVSIMVVDAGKGILQVSWIEELKLESYEVRLRQSGDWVFASVKENEDSPYFLWGRVGKEDDQLVLWAPSHERFKALVEEGVLPGNKDEDGDVVLGQLGEEHYILLTAEHQGVLFDWGTPVVMIRLAY